VRVLGAAAASAIQADACLIQRVSDGDTVVCRDGRRVRLLLIDAPEMDQGPFGLAAKAALQKLLPPGQQVALEPDVDPQDRYGRMLAYVYLPVGRMTTRSGRAADHRRERRVDPEGG
jgi:micrococcal nuclease